MESAMSVAYRTMTVAEVEVFYREAGPVDAPVILLLHGFPTAGHMFRDLIPSLSNRYRVIAPDLPGFGNTNSPPRGPLPTCSITSRMKPGTSKRICLRLSVSIPPRVSMIFCTLRMARSS